MSELTDTVITIGRPEQLQGWQYRPSLPLEDRRAYRSFLGRAKRVASITWHQNPQFTVRPYQYESAALYACRRANICAGSQGVGKTLIVGFMIATLYPHLRQARPGFVQIIAPSVLSARSRWWVDLNRIPHLQGLVEVVSNRRELEKARAPIWVYHPELLTIKVDKGRRRPWLAQDLGRNRAPALLVVDEVHHFKPENQRTQALTYLRSRSRRCLALSGTLTDARLDLLHHTCRLVYGRHWPYGDGRQFKQAMGCKETVRTRAFEEDLGTGTCFQKPERYLDFIALPQLADYFQLLNRFVHRLSLNQSKVRPYCTLPEKLEINHRLNPSPLQREQHLQYLQEHRVWVEQLLQYGSAKHIFSLFQPLLRLSMIPPEREQSEKFKKLVSVVMGSSRTGIFCPTVESSRWLTQALELYFPRQVVRLYAQDPLAEPERLKPEQREAVLEQLLFDPNVKVGVLSLNLASESIDLTSLSDLCFWGVNWSSLQAAQAVARAVRPGSLFSEVRVHWFYHQGLLDEHQVKLIQEKLRVSRRLLDYDPYLLSEAELTPSDPRQILAEMAKKDL